VKNTLREPAESPALDALTELLRASAKSPSPHALERGLHRLRTGATEKSSRPQRVRGGWRFRVTVTFCFALGAAGVWLFRGAWHAAERPVAVNLIEGGKLLDGGYLEESGRAGVKVLFNEGTQFELSPGTRGRLRAVEKDGAKFAIDRGTAAFRIVPSLGHHWSVEAGPFIVAVKGTDFTVNWDPSNERLEVSLRRGRVAISGPILSADLVLRPGQKLSVDLPKAEALITQERQAPVADAISTPSSAAATPPRALPVASSEHAEPRSLAEAPAATASAGERRWAKSLANGQWDRILADVERDGVEATLLAASSADLFALADAARYRRRTDLARSALLAQLRRFPSSPRSSDATFLLGRTEELSGGAKPQAIRWYDDYLSRAPGGTYAAEALGRKMILLSEVGRRDDARHVADDYLRRFPEGSYVGAARVFVRSP
jgi:TolA-binding protein